jgi:macrolide transport system ATP-binding/permease protein
MQSFWQDMKYAMRSLRNSPGFAIIAVVTLGLGMAVNTTVFSVVNGLLLRSLPVPHAEQITVLAMKQPGAEGFQSFSYPDFQDIRSQAEASGEVFGYRTTLVGLIADGKGDHCVMSRVTGNYFSALGIKPALGRLILPTEGQAPGADPVLVLGYGYWQKRFGGDKSVIGKQVQVDDHPVTIIGVTPKDFQGTYGFLDMDGYVPLSAIAGPGGNESVQEIWTHREQRSLTLMERLKPSVDLKQAKATLDVIARRIGEQHPETDKGITYQIFPERLARPEPDPDNTLPNVSLAFTVLAGLVLLVACFNIANVLLVRATVRQREMAIRAAIGAGRARLVRQHLTESLVLAILGGGAGLLLGWWASGFLSSLPLGTDLPVTFNFQPDLRVYLFTLTAVVVTGAVVGIMPALRVARTDVNSMLREGGRGSSEGPRRHLVRNTLVIAQVAGSLLLLIVAGLFIRSAGKAREIDLGLNPDHVIDVPLDVQQLGYTEQQGKAFYRDAEERLRNLPGVVSVSQAFSVPLGLMSASERIIVEEHPLEAGQPEPVVYYNMVSPDYFDTLRIALHRGRVFTKADSEKAAKVAIVNEAMAKKFWPSEEVLGKRFRVKGPAKADQGLIEVVGVVQNGKYRGVVEDPLPAFYVPMEQSYMPLRTIHVRTSVPPEGMEQQIAAQLQELAPGLPISGMRTLRADLEGINGYLFYRLGAQLTTAIGLLGLILAVVGVYSVVSYAAVQRTHEIGIRMALGAKPQDILTMVLGQSLIVIGVGIVIGLGGAFAGTRLLGSLLVGVSSSDPATFVIVAVTLAAFALLACWLPARRATHVSPLVALRYE